MRPTCEADARGSTRPRSHRALAPARRARRLAFPHFHPTSVRTLLDCSAACRCCSPAAAAPASPTQPAPPPVDRPLACARRPARRRDAGLSDSRGRRARLGGADPALARATPRARRRDRRRARRSAGSRRSGCIPRTSRARRERNPTYAVDPYALAVEPLRDAGTRAGAKLGDPLATQLRTIIALQDCARRAAARRAAVRAGQVRPGNCRPPRSRCVDARLGDVRWIGEACEAIRRRRSRARCSRASPATSPI